MARIVEQIVFPVPEFNSRINVAAYARVSSGKDTMLHSLSAQVSYYSELIRSNPEWKFCGVYADEAITGTKDSRPEFQRMISDCRLGKIKLIITKSISRFARNTVTLLETVRELKLYDVDVYFEEQNLHSISADGEFLLTILSSYAQEESYPQVKIRNGKSVKAFRKEKQAVSRFSDTKETPKAFLKLFLKKLKLYG